MMAWAGNTKNLVVTATLEELEANLQRCLGGRVNDFQLLLTPEGLILRGRAATYYAKQLAQQAVLEKTQHPILANEIEVD